MAITWRANVSWRSTYTWRGELRASVARPCYSVQSDGRRYVSLRRTARSFRSARGNPREWSAQFVCGVVGVDMSTLWEAKDPAEKLTATFDFSNEIAGGESISSASLACTVISGTDASPEQVLNGAATISGSSVLQPFQGGISGVTYDLRCVATLSSGRVLVLAATLPVRSA